MPRDPYSVVEALMRDLEPVLAKHGVSQLAFACTIDGIEGLNTGYVSDLQRSAAETAGFLLETPDALDQLVLDLSPWPEAATE